MLPISVVSAWLVNFRHSIYKIVVHQGQPTTWRKRTPVDHDDMCCQNRIRSNPNPKTVEGCRRRVTLVGWIETTAFQREPLGVPMDQFSINVNPLYQRVHTARESRSASMVYGELPHILRRITSKMPCRRISRTFAK